MDAATQSTMFSSADQTWTTPRDLFDHFNESYGFILDAAAMKDTALCPDYLGPDHDDPARRDALTANWPTDGSIWLNPPYDRCAEFLVKAEEAGDQLHKIRDAVICLIPARTDTRYWHRTVFPLASRIWFIQGRLKFGGGKNAAPFPSAVVEFTRYKRLSGPTISRLLKTPYGWHSAAIA